MCPSIEWFSEGRVRWESTDLRRQKWVDWWDGGVNKKKLGLSGSFVVLCL